MELFAGVLTAALCVLSIVMAYVTMVAVRAMVSMSETGHYEKLLKERTARGSPKIESELDDTASMRQPPPPESLWERAPTGGDP